MIKKILITFVISLLFLICSCSCKTQNSIHIYDEDALWSTYLDLFYNSINTEGSNYAAFDLRTKEDYENEHLIQFQNYDLKNGNILEFNNHLKNNYSKKYTIYLYIESLDDLTYFNSLLETYSTIHLFIGTYNNYKSLGIDLFTFDSGPYDCNC